MANPFQDKQDTTGGKAGFDAFDELTSDKAYDDETLKDNPGAPLPTPVANPPETFIKGRQVTRPDYEGIQLQKFKDLKKTCEAMDDIFEREYIDKINYKKGEIATIMSEAFGAIPAIPTATQQLITTPASAPETGLVYQAGIGTLSYAENDSVDPPTSLIGVKGQIFPDILAAFHYPALSNESHGETDLPFSNGTYIRVSRNISTGPGEYSVNNLGIGETVYHSGDNDGENPIAPAYAGAVGVVTSQAPIGNFYFFGGTVTNNIGANIDVVRAGSSTSITGITTEINDLRLSLRVRIGPPQEDNDAGINTLRSTKTRDELAVWYDEAGNRTSNIQDYQGGINALTGLATSISEYNG
mgnify:CR=1 FL=1|jgi:hypothetical protein|tara:strand:+ start:6354 stop:7421 length:1068 start_codon:yes stop_codon:yes gene_type:complete